MSPDEVLRFHARRALGLAPARLLARAPLRALLLEWLSPAERLELALASAATLPADERDALAAAARALAREDDRGAEYAAAGCSNTRGLLAPHGGVEGAVILELGTGHSLGQGALLVATGAARYHGVDPFPVARRDAEHYRRLRALLAEEPLVAPAPGAREAALARFDAALRPGPAGIDPDPALLALHAADAAAIPLPDASVTRCISKSAFEHFRDPGGAARESLRVLVPGGVGVHVIDLRDHRSLHERPRRFLRHSAAEWESVFEGPPNRPLSPELGRTRDPFEYTNRWRLSRYVDAFRAAGAAVEVQVQEARPLAPGEREALDPEFRACSAEDLEVLSVQLTVRRA
ncbi:MAG: methyltransferase domain-containing protein [Planctomycetota bacterium]